MTKEDIKLKNSVYYILTAINIINIVILIIVGFLMIKANEITKIKIAQQIQLLVSFIIITKLFSSILFNIKKSEQVSIITLSLFTLLLVFIMSFLSRSINVYHASKVIFVFFGIYMILYNYIILQNTKKNYPLMVTNILLTIFSAILLFALLASIKAILIDGIIEVQTLMAPITITFASLLFINEVLYIAIPAMYEEEELKDSILNSILNDGKDAFKAKKNKAKVKEINKDKAKSKAKPEVKDKEKTEAKTKTKTKTKTKAATKKNAKETEVKKESKSKKNKEKTAETSKTKTKPKKNIKSKAKPLTKEAAKKKAKKTKA